MRFIVQLFFAVPALLVLTACSSVQTAPAVRPLVLLTDFGVKDGAVSAMRGVAYQVSTEVLLADLTHEIPPFDIWQGAYRLKQTAPYWPANSVFVTVVDPGVGSERKSVVAKTKSGQLFVGPDNGHLTLIAELDPIIEVRVIDESRNRRKGSEESYTFHGRDLYAYVGALLASGKLAYEDVGPELGREVISIPYQAPTFQNGILSGTIPILDPNYGNVWTNIPKKMVLEHFAGAKKLQVKVMNKRKIVYQADLPLVETFASVKEGQPLLYFNSLLELSLALNMANFAQKHKVSSGQDWTITLSR